ncbi:hypothetical protein [Legionella clemsonensis]|uniref:Uncharacterized protein n=1 Tax=Legionella clemsonensis TaxID=1867846 RepID=A0A222P6B6_9GAMM|nr:hypothetical protein [Legionella clemsonensis]ASQ47315.1 hypothetical protein clem_13945 [Legionella clemsonensis]
MYVEQSSFAGMDRSQGFGELLDSIPTKVIISDLEKTLREYEHELGLKLNIKKSKTLMN